MEKIHILKINDHIVLNIVDLQEHFYPWEIYDQREAFEVFAQVHCCPLTIWIKGENGAMDAARYLDKHFWLELLRQKSDMEHREDHTPMDLIQGYLDKMLGGEIQKEEAAKRVRQEISALSLADKLEHICSSADLTVGEAETAVSLLALCELAEIDARKQDFHRWLPPVEAAQEQHDDVEQRLGQEQDLPVQVTAGEVSDFPEVDKVVLRTRREPYRFRYHEADTLESGTIKTVRLEASSRDGQELRVELCREDGSVVQTLEMKAGEYRDCNVANHRMICVLPTLSISDTLCVARKNYASTEITIIPRDATEWTLNMDAATEKKISGFAAGDNVKEGFLYLRSGRLMKGFYKPNENYGIRQQLEMVEDKLVEVRLAEGCYELLTEHGEIISSNPQRNGRTGVVSLYPRTTSQHKEFREIVYSNSGASTAMHERDTEQCNVRFG